MGQLVGQGGAMWVYVGQGGGMPNLFLIFVMANNWYFKILYFCSETKIPRKFPLRHTRWENVNSSSAIIQTL
jgi:hypothetical protein